MVFQFAAAIVLVVSTAVVYQQVQYMLSENLSFNMEQTLVVARPSIRPEDGDAQKDQYNQFKTELLRSAAIRRVSGASYVPGHSRQFKFNFRRYGTPAEEAQAIRVSRKPLRTWRPPGTRFFRVIRFPTFS